MTMTWDAPLVTALASELADALRGERLRAFFLDHPGLGAHFWFRRATLAFRLGPGEGYVTMGAASEPLEESRPLVAVVEAVEALPDDRILLLRTRRPRGGREAVLVIAELISNQWNLAVTRGDDRTVRHVLRDRGGRRPIQVGVRWHPPPASDREGRARDLSRRRWHELLDEVEPGRRRSVLLSSVAWTSSLNADAFLDDVGTAGSEETARALDRGYDHWVRVSRCAESPQPVILQLPSGPQPYPTPLPEVEARPAESLLGAIDEARRMAGSSAPTGFPTSWIAALDDRIAEAEARVHSLERELESAPDPDEARSIGDLLLARFKDVPRGRTRVTLEDFTGETVEIDLDPTLEPQENASRWYDRAARAERALRRLPQLLEAARADVASVRELLERVRRGDASPDEVRACLPKRSDKSPSPGGPRLPYRRFQSSGGLEIRVGRGARHNDDLTFHHSEPDDIWLHARHVGGAHVVLRWTGKGSPPAKDLAEAATLAALHSSARTSASVPVDWARRKHVRKPRKSPPGRVVVDRPQTVFVEPDPAVAERLLNE